MLVPSSRHVQSEPSSGARRSGQRAGKVGEGHGGSGRASAPRGGVAEHAPPVCHGQVRLEAPLVTQEEELREEETSHRADTARRWCPHPKASHSEGCRRSPPHRPETQKGQEFLAFRRVPCGPPRRARGPRRSPCKRRCRNVRVGRARPGKSPERGVDTVANFNRVILDRKPDEGSGTPVHPEWRTSSELQHHRQPGPVQERGGRLLRHHLLARARRDGHQLQEEGRSRPRRGASAVPHLGGQGREAEPSAPRSTSSPTTSSSSVRGTAEKTGAALPKAPPAAPRAAVVRARGGRWARKATRISPSSQTVYDAKATVAREGLQVSRPRR